jgi:hypothetical protein
MGTQLTFTKYIISKILMILLVSSFVYFLVESEGDRPQSNDKVILPTDATAEQNAINEEQKTTTVDSRPIE